MRSTNPIWRLAPVSCELGSWNEEAKLVLAGDNDGAGRKSSGWWMNLKRAGCKGGSSAKGGTLR